jgi:hypothetical protein
LEDIPPTAKTIAKYFIEEPAKKDKQIEELKLVLNECRIGGNDSQV